MSTSTSLKVYLIDENLKEIEIRRFDIPASELIYTKLVAKISEMFPELTGKIFTIYWKDFENDKLVISSNDELFMALREMKVNVKKFYVMVKSSKRQNGGAEVDGIHPNIFCDGCSCNVMGYRYKCLACKDYDLCRECEQAGIHPEHPMLRIPNHFLFDQVDICKMMQYFSSFVPLRFDAKHFRHRRRHSHDHSDSRKKRRCDKHDSGPETGEESDENRRKKHSHRRCGYQKVVDASKKIQEALIDELFYSPGIYSQLMGDFYRHPDPVYFSKEETLKTDMREETNEEPKGRPSHVKNLKSMVETLISLLNPLGVNVDFEIRSDDAEANKKKQTEKSEKKEQTETPAPPIKEVRFATPEQNVEIMKQRVEEITKILANQALNQSPENEGWVSFEELKRDSDEPQPSTSTEAISRTLNTEEPTPQAEKTSQETSFLYPTLNSEQQMPANPAVRNALEKMLAMGFTNEGDWLTHLLEAKNGDINQALESLAPQKK